MKIAILVGLFPPKWIAGTELATRIIASELANRGHEVSVITTLDEGLPFFEIFRNFSVYRIKYPQISPKIRIISFIVNSIGVIVFYYKVYSTLQKIKPDIVHAQQISMSFHSFLRKIIFGTPYVVFARGIYFSDVNKLQKILYILSLKFSNALIVMSDFMKTQFLPYYKGKMYVIPNGIELEKYRPNVKNSIRSKYNIQNEEKIILFIGRLHAIKGINDIIHALPIIKEKIPHVRLVLIGPDQGEKTSLEQLIHTYGLEKEVILTGQVKPEDMQEYLHASDIFVLPSLSEGFPNVILEAMAAGLPVVSTNVSGIPEVIMDGQNGFLVNPRSPEEIAEKSVKLLTDDLLYRKISQNNIEKVKNYSLENVIQKIEAVYRACI